MREAEFARQRLPRGIEVDTDDHVRSRHAGALDHVEADAAKTEYHYIRARLNLGRIDHRADAGGDPTADITDLVEWRVFADLGHRDFGQHREVGERRTSHVVIQRFATEREAAGTVRHHALALGCPNGGT